MVRYKHRYIIGEVRTEARPAHAPFVLHTHILYSAILNKVQQLHGDFGVAAVMRGLLVKYCNPYTKIVLIRVRHGPHRFITSILSLDYKLRDVKIKITTLHVGATMRQCFRLIRNHQVKTLESYWNQMKTDEDRKRLKEALFDLSGLTALPTRSVAMEPTDVR